jgi:catechol 2,3-dioxygenase-like lactoylglutathione lyase family enzyme
MRVESLDHLVLTVRDVGATVDFYGGVLGMDVQTFGEGRTALRFGTQRIHVHELGAGLTPVAAAPTPGSADLCFLSATPMDAMLEQLQAFGVDVVEGPTDRVGAAGNLLSVYVRDPDGNLVEISNVR